MNGPVLRSANHVILTEMMISQNQRGHQQSVYFSAEHSGWVGIEGTLLLF